MKNHFTPCRLPAPFRHLLLLTTLLLAGLTAQSQTTWTGATDSEWTTPGNWSAGVPDAADDVTIPNVTNDPVITTAAVAGSVRINTGGLLTINAGASLTLTPVTNQNFVDGTLVNYGTFTVTAGTNIQDCLYNTGTVQNKPTGTIRLNGAWGNGIWNVTATSNVTNEGTIILGDNIQTGSSGILNSGTLTNTATGTLQIDRSRGNALVNTNTITNSGTILIGTLGVPGRNAVEQLNENAAMFTNEACGVIRAFANVLIRSGTFTNNGYVLVNSVKLYTAPAVRVNSPAGVAGSYSFEPAAFGANVATVSLTADAVFVDDGSANPTLGCDPPTNGAQLAGKIALIDRGSCNFSQKCYYAQQAGAIAVIVFNNVAGYVIMAPGAFADQVTIPCVLLSQADGQTLRAALSSGPVNISIGQVLPTIAPTTNNGIIEYPQGNPIPNVTNNDLIVAPVSGCNPTVAPALQIGGSNSFTAGSTWFKDEALTQVAGTYNQGTNTFTATNLAAGSSHTLYFPATDNANGCTRTVSVRVELIPASFTQGASVSGGPVCAGQAVTLSFDANDCFKTGNTFTVQLSDASGSFVNPVTLPGTVSAGNTQVVIPPNTPGGTGYRLRVVGNNPAVASDPSAAFTVNALGAVAVGQLPTTPAKTCQGDPLPVTFAATGSCPFPLGNVFTVQLSNAFGSFANPTVLGTALPGTTTFPASALNGLPAGTGYRVRILSSNPATTSAASLPFKLEGPNLTLTPTVGGATVCRGSAVTVSFSLASCPFPEGNGFTAQLSSASGNFNNPVNLGPVTPDMANNLTIPANVATGSGYRIRIASSSPALTSSGSASFQVKACANRMSVEGPELVISPNPVVQGEIRCRVGGLDNPQFNLTTAAGRELAVSVKTDGTGVFVLTPRQVLAPGVYLVEAREGSSRLTRRVLVAE